MIEKWLKMLAGFIVDAAFAKLGITSLDDLTAKLATAFKAELSDDLAKLDAIPEQVVAAVGGQINGVVQQFNGVVQQLAALPQQMLANLPDFGALINQAIQQFNPFK